MERGIRGLLPLLGAAMALVIVLSGCSAADHRGPKPSASAAARSSMDVVATVSGHPIVREEVKQIAELTGARTSAEQMRAAVRFKVIQLEAQRRGLVDEVDFSALASGMRARNEANASEKSSGGVVYGVSSFDLETYFAHMESTTRSALQSAMATAGELDVTDSQLQTLYAQDPDGIDDQPDTVTADLVRFEATDAGAAAASSVQHALAAGGTLAEQLGEHADVVTDASTLVIDPETAYALSKYQTSLYSAAMSLQPGRAVVVTDDIGGGIVLLRCNSRAQSPKRSFAEVESELRTRAEDQLFEKRVDDLVSAAQIQELPASPRP